jgi:hypothetical protein
MSPLILSSYRIDLQDDIRHIPCDSSDDSIQKRRANLAMLLCQLKQHQDIAGVFGVGEVSQSEENECQFDDLDDAEPAAITEATTADEPTPIERQPIHLPSNDPAHQHFQDLELSLRTEQANRHLDRLRQLISEKSFQYSHVIRDAPTSSIKTRSRATLTSLNRRIAHHSRVYNRCRAAIARLGADEHTLGLYRELSRKDLHASTAILDPNMPGSSSIRLSWIWGHHPAAIGSAGHGADAAAVQECTSPFFAYSYFLTGLYS